MHLIYNLLIETLILITVVTTTQGVNFESGFFSMIIAGVLLGFLMFAIEPILGFLKFPKNFWSYLIVGGILNTVYFILLNTVLLGIIDFGVGSIGGGFGPIEFERISLETETYTVIFTAFYTLLFSLFVNQLSKYR